MLSFEKFIPQLLTNEELKALKKRFQIIDLLKAGLTYREIALQMGISTTTVVRLNKRLKIRRRRSKASSFSTMPKKAKLPWRIG